MTISTTSSVQTFIGNGVTNPFSFNLILGSSSNVSVIYTDATGIQTLLLPTQYTLFLNPAATGSLWGVGGTITYPKIGSPIATGTSLTISRILPLTQTTSISNQGDFYAQAVEQALDTVVLELQQVAGRTGQLRGTWQTGITYNFGDIIQDGANGLNTLNYYTCISSNTSSVWTTDLAAGYWSLSLNVQNIQYAGGIVTGQFGGTGIANTGKTITIGGNLVTSGAFSTTLTVTGTTTVTLPTSGVLLSTATAVTGAQGGTGQTTYAVGDLLQGAAANTLSKLAAVATGNVLISGGVTTASSWGKVSLTTAVIGVLPIANGGTNDTGTAWTAYTPTVTAGSGTFTSVSATGRYKTLGKTVFYELMITVTTNGTAATNTQVSVPFTSAGFAYTASGREIGVTGNIIQGVITASTSTLTITTATNTYIGVNGSILVITGVYETA